MSFTLTLPSSPTQVIVVGTHIPWTQKQGHCCTCGSSGTAGDTSGTAPCKVMCACGAREQCFVGLVHLVWYGTCVRNYTREKMKKCGEVPSLIWLLCMHCLQDAPPCGTGRTNSAFLAPFSNQLVSQDAYTSTRLHLQPRQKEASHGVWPAKRRLARFSTCIAVPTTTYTPLLWNRVARSSEPAWRDRR